MGVVINVTTRQPCKFVHGRCLAFPLELPEGDDIDDAQMRLDTGQKIFGRRLFLEKQIDVVHLGLDPGDGPVIKMVRQERPWEVRPCDVSRIAPWRGPRIGRWEEP